MTNVNGRKTREVERIHTHMLKSRLREVKLSKPIKHSKALRSQVPRDPSPLILYLAKSDLNQLYGNTPLNGDLESARQYAQFLFALFPRSVIERVLSKAEAFESCQDDQYPHAQITKHPGGMVEIRAGQETLVLTEAEYLAARRRGESVIRNRALNRMRIIREDHQDICSRQNDRGDQG